jgi:hypothetical protein
MSPTWILLLVFALFLVPATAACRVPSGRYLKGFYLASVDALPVQEAMRFVQGQLTALRIDQVLKAATRVEGGLKVKLICRVAAQAAAPATWEFQAYRKLDGSWSLHSARLL